MLSQKARTVLEELNPLEKENLESMSFPGRNQFLTERFGNESEKSGVSFGLFPLWVKEVLDELERRPG